MYKFFIALSGIIAILLTLLLAELPSSSTLGVSLPLDDQHASYTIEKLGGNYVVIYEKGSHRSVLIVGNSIPELESALGKQVKIKGSWARTESEIPRHVTQTQCVANKCHKLFRENNRDAVTVNIEALSII